MASRISAAESRDRIGSVVPLSVEAEVRQRMNALMDACQNGDINRVLSFYAPDVVVHDCPPKLRLRGREEFGHSFEKWFISAFQFPVKYDTREEKIITNGDLAVLHGLVNVKGKFRENGEEMSVWLRHTVMLQKINGEWLITHEHSSVPVDEKMQALMGLDPDWDRAV